MSSEAKEVIHSDAVKLVIWIILSYILQKLYLDQRLIIQLLVSLNDFYCYIYIIFMVMCLRYLTKRTLPQYLQDLKLVCNMIISD